MTRKAVSSKAGDQIFAGCALLGVAAAVITAVLLRHEPPETWVALAITIGAGTTMLACLLAPLVFKIPPSP